MGKASRLKERTAREKVAARQAAMRRAQRRRQLLITGASVLAVAVIVLAFVLVKVTRGTSSASGKPTYGAAAAAVVRTVARVPASTLAAVGAGTGQLNKPRAIAGPPLTANGKPEVLYLGAEYCPFCAAERWSLTLALSRFGTFSGVGLIHSSSSDVFANTPTLTYYKSRYASKYLTFITVEEQTVDRKPLQTATPQQNALVAKYDAAPYTSSPGSIPFISFGGKYWLIGGSSYLPQVLHGLTWSQVAASLANPVSPVAKQADGAANYLTAAICKITNNQPASVCTSPVIKKLQGTL